MIRQFICSADKTLYDVLKVINRSGKGVAFIVDGSDVLKGLLTDGDIRHLLLDGHDLQARAQDVLNKNYVFAKSSESYGEIIGKFNDQIKIIPVVDESHRVVDYFEFKSNIHLPMAVPDIGEHEMKYLMDAFLSTWISSSGKYMGLFEDKFAGFCGCKFGVAVSNGTVALHLALKALGIGEGDEVIVPDLTFAATINAVLHAHAVPVIVDVEPESWCIDPAQVEKAVTRRTKAIIPVHLYGQPCEMDALLKICRRRNLFMIEDCAEAHGARYGGKRVGGFGDIGCFSFYGNKVITTGEGGMCVVNSEELAHKMRILRDHGMSRHKKYWHDVIGYNYRMTNLQAAIGVAQIERIDEILKKRSRIEDEYRKVFAGLKGFQMQRNNLPGRDKITWLVCVLLAQGYNRDRYMKQLSRNGVETRPFFYPLSCMDIYKKYSFSSAHSRSISRRGINLPTFARMKEIKREWFEMDPRVAVAASCRATS